jgi:hypothetical protein
MKTHRGMRGLNALGVVMVGIFVAGAVASRPAAAQDTTQMSASLLRRLAEAVDGQRNNRPVWVVIQRDFPHDVNGVYWSATQAKEIAARLSGYIVSGPFITPPDSGLKTMMYSVDPCPGWHDSFSFCHDTTFQGSSALLPVDDVDSMVVTVYSRHAPIRRAFPRASVDALFFTLSAIDKFVVPYYTRLYGPEVAARMRSQYLKQIGERAQRALR